LVSALMDAITRRLAARLNYLDARKSLLILSADKGALSAIGAPRELVDHRSRNSEILRFSFQAAFFCYCSMVAERTAGFAYALWKDQQSDIDCIFRRRTPNGVFEYEAVQLKEWPPLETSPSASLEGILAALPRHYTDNTGLRVGVYLNRDSVVPVGELPIPAIRVASLWLYGLGGRPGTEAFLCGNLLQGVRTVQLVGLPKLPSSLTALPRSANAD
jgi:hypothetical protein